LGGCGGLENVIFELEGLSQVQGQALLVWVPERGGEGVMELPE